MPVNMWTEKSHITDNFRMSNYWCNCYLHYTTYSDSKSHLVAIRIHKLLAHQSAGQPMTNTPNCSITLLKEPRSLLRQPHEPSFHPSFHRSSTRLQSNSGFPSLRFTSLCRRHSHCENWCLLLVSGVFVFRLRKEQKQICHVFVNKTNKSCCILPESSYYSCDVTLLFQL